MSAPTDDEAKSYGSGTGTTVCYIVEARSVLKHPIVLSDGTAFGTEWSRVPVRLGANGVNVQLFCPQAESMGFMDYEAANAMAWWFIANASELRREGQLLFRAIGLETRLVRVKVVYTYSAVESGVGPVLAQHEDRAAFTDRAAREAKG